MGSTPVAIGGSRPRSASSPDLQNPLASASAGEYVMKKRVRFVKHSL
jgi:hypothetical protein